MAQKLFVLLPCLIVQAIRANPDRKAKSEKPHDLKFQRPARRNASQRKDRVKQKKAARVRSLLKAAEADE